MLIRGGNSQHVTVKWGVNTTVQFSCSMTYRNRHYIFGGKIGTAYNRQIAQVKVRTIQAIQNMAFDFESGACANVDDSYMFLCFHSPSNEPFERNGQNEQKKCRAAFEPEGTFFVLKSQSAHNHTNIGFAASKCEFHSKSDRNITKNKFDLNNCSLL